MSSEVKPLHELEDDYIAALNRRIELDSKTKCLIASIGGGPLAPEKAAELRDFLQADRMAERELKSARKGYLQAKRIWVPCTRPTRTDEELQTATSHVTYEVEMLVVSARYLPCGFSSPADDITANMTLESFLLHFRNLRAFLCPSLQKLDNDDIVASDFLSAPRPEDVGDVTVLGRRKKKIDRLLAHLSYSRQQYVELGNKSWPIAEMVADIGNGLQRFFQRLPPRYSNWFHEAETTLKSHIVRDTTAVGSMGYTSTVVKRDVLHFSGVDRDLVNDKTKSKPEGEDCYDE